MHWKEIPIYIIDFEGSQKTGVVEFGIVTLLEGEIVKTETSLCQAAGDIPQHDFAQHCIRREETEAYEPFQAHWNLFTHLRRTGPLGAHHARVENAFIKAVWPYPSSAPDFMNPGNIVADWGPWVDTCALYARCYPDLNSYKLGDLIAQFDETEELEVLAKEYCPPNRNRYHCALYDALASARLLLRLCGEAPYADVSLSWLLAESASSNAKRTSLQQGDLFD